MPTIAATVDNLKAQVRLDLDFSDIDAPYAYVNRVDPVTGATTAVRGHGVTASIGSLPYAPLNAGYKAVLYDTEASPDMAYYYTATSPSGIVLNQGSTFAGGYIDPWYPTDPAIFLRVTTNRAAASFLTMSTAGATASPTIRGEDFPATPGATLSMTAVVTSNISIGVTCGFSYRDASGTVLSTAATLTTVLATSTTIVTSGTAPANTVSCQPVVILSGTPAATTTVSVSSFVISPAAGSATSGAVSVPSLALSQLKDPLRPGNNQRVHLAFEPDPLCTPIEGIFYQSLDTEQQAPNAAAFNVNNQVNPVIVSKARSSVTSTLTLVTRTFADRDAVLALLAPGSPLLFQVPDAFGQPDRYMSVGASTVSRLFPDHRIPLRVISMPFTTCGPPAGPMQGTVGARWSDTCNRYANWAAVTSAGLTWVQILDGLAG